MKVLQLSSQVYEVPPGHYGGLEQVIFDLSHCLGAMGHDVYVLCPDGSKGDKFNVLTPVKGGLHSPEAAAYEAAKASMGDYEILHGHGWGGFQYQWKRDHPQARVLQTLHGPVTFHTKPVDKPCFVAASQAHADWLKWELNQDARVVHHGIQLDRYPFCAEKDDYLLFLARVSEEKGPLDFVKLCRAVKMKGILAGPDQGTVSGMGYVKAVMDACSDTNGLVRYMGLVANNEQKVELLQKARCLVSPLRPPYIEIFGLSSIEGMACGTPILATDLGAGRELVVHGKTGAIVRDITLLAEGLKIALECAPEVCRQRAEEFSREKMAAEYLALYRQMVQEDLSW